MDKHRWTAIGLEIAEHLMEIRRIAKQNNIHLSMAAFQDGHSWATYIDDNGKVFEVCIKKPGAVVLIEDQEEYYTKA